MARRLSRHPARTHWPRRWVRSRLLLNFELSMGFPELTRFRRWAVRLYYTNKVRRAAAACGPGLRVNGASSVTRKTSLGRNVHFNGMRITGRGTVIVGDNFHSGQQCQIISETHNYRGEALPYDDTFVPRDVAIGDNVWLGFHVLVLGGVTIGEGAIIQAGSVVVRPIPALAIAGGNPAEAFAGRDPAHYDRLKRESRFH